MRWLLFLEYDQSLPDLLGSLFVSVCVLILSNYFHYSSETKFILLSICTFIESMYTVPNSNIKLGILRKATLRSGPLLSPPTSTLELIFSISRKIIYDLKCIMYL